MSAQRRGLGRGLKALIPAAPTPEDSVPTGPAGGVSAPSAAMPSLTQERGVAAAKLASLPQAAVSRETEEPVAPGASAHADAEASEVAYFAELPLDSISPNPRQPRDVFDEEALAELVTSIKEVGLLQPVVVRQVGPESFELIMGERRWRASREAELERIPAIVRATDDEKLLLDALLENLHRAQLNPLEEAKAYEQLLTDFNCTHDQLADRIGRSRPQVSNTLRLLKLSPAVQKRVAAGVLSAGHARALLGVEDSEEQDRLALRIVAEGLSVRAVEEIVTLMGSHSKAAPRAKGPRTGTLVSPGLNRLATRLSDRFDTRVKVDMGQKKGKIIVEFADLGDLRRIMGTLAPDEESLLQEGLPETDEADGES
ncbi:ParB/RepB/Spo0J family partition protein [Streptomyces sp. SID5785]|uniref:ParB/RepB/Spo0J family partition protein n=2 Tax=Streptomyces sp. SID5785 TaxID=2690309 RepID=UPI0013618DBA|nr:ParB/RepB/Spo0J family partition protein [Streptomyces sp. SID5785]MZD06839.1 ParB/RepB/Spo0J family partition protein [Streptomyces sp. SID5785]